MHQGTSEECAPRDKLLNEAIAGIDQTLDITPNPHRIRLYVMIHPDDPDGALRAWLTTGDNFKRVVPEMYKAARTIRPKGSFEHDLHEYPNIQQRAPGWRFGSNLAGTTADRLIDLEVQPNGDGHLFSAAVGERHRKDGKIPGYPIRLFEDAVAVLPQRAFAAFGKLYEQAGYIGPVDLGVAVIGLAGNNLLSGSNANEHKPLTPVPFEDDHRDTDQVRADELRTGAATIARHLLMPLIQATAQGYDPFQ